MQPYYTALKFIRRRLSELAANPDRADEPARVWPCVRQQLEVWLRALAAAGPRHPARDVPYDVPEVTLFTDACTTGWGAVMYDHERSIIASVGGKWTPSEARLHINELEIEAVRKTLMAWPGLQGCDVHLRVDNTSALAGIKRQYSHAWALNERLGKLAPWLQQLRHVTVDYVATKQNWADAPSRGLPFIWNHQLASPWGRGVDRRDVGGHG